MDLFVGIGDWEDRASQLEKNRCGLQNKLDRDDLPSDKREMYEFHLGRLERVIAKHYSSTRI
ncbi:hypothetical protein ACFL11_00080 [Patescibacteria group bacterium]